MYRLLSLGSQVIVSGGNFAATLIISIQYGLDVLGAVMVYLLIANMAMSLQLNYFLTPAIVQFPKCPQDIRFWFLKAVVLEYFGVLALVTPAALAFTIFTDIDQGGVTALTLVVAFTVSDFLKKTLIICQSIGILFLNDGVVYASLLALLWFAPDRTATTIFGIYAWVFVISCVVLAGALGWSLWQVRRVTQTHRAPDLDMIRNRQQFGADMLKSAVLQIASGNGLIFIAALNLSQTTLGIIRLAQSLTSIVNPLFVYMGTFVQAELATKANYKVRTRRILRWFLRLYPVGACVYGAGVFVFYQRSVPQQLTPELIVNFAGYLLLTYLIGIAGLLRLEVQLAQQGTNVLRSYILASLVTLPMIWPMSYLLGSYGVVLTMICGLISMIAYFVKRVDDV
jgi:hypothetical protein